MKSALRARKRIATAITAAALVGVPTVAAPTADASTTPRWLHGVCSSLYGFGTQHRTCGNAYVKPVRRGRCIIKKTQITVRNYQTFKGGKLHRVNDSATFHIQDHPAIIGQTASIEDGPYTKWERGRFTVNKAGGGGQTGAIKRVFDPADKSARSVDIWFTRVKTRLDNGMPDAVRTIRFNVPCPRP